MIEDIEQREENGSSLSRIGFWARFAGHKLAQKTHELTFFSYMAKKMFQYRGVNLDEAENFLPSDQEVSLDGISMAKDGSLLVNNLSMRAQLESMQGVEVVDGRVYTCARFGDLAAHAELSECR